MRLQLALTHFIFPSLPTYMYVFCLKACSFSLLRCWCFQLKPGVTRDDVGVKYDVHEGFRLNYLRSNYSAIYECKAMNADCEYKAMNAVRSYTVMLWISCKTINNIYFKFAAICYIIGR